MGAILLKWLMEVCMADKTQQRARKAVKETIIPALRTAIEALAEDIAAETGKQFSMAHRPELEVGARSTAANAVLSELARYLMQDDEIAPALTRWDHLAEDRVKRWFSR
jgi:hypothetical protein